MKNDKCAIFGEFVCLFVLRQGRRDSTPALLRLTVRHNFFACAFLFLGLRPNGSAGCGRAVFCGSKVKRLKVEKRWQHLKNWRERTELAAVRPCGGSWSGAH